MNITIVSLLLSVSAIANQPQLSMDTDLVPDFVAHTSAMTSVGVKAKTQLKALASYSAPLSWLASTTIGHTTCSFHFDHNYTNSLGHKEFHYVPEGTFWAMNNQEYQTINTNNHTPHFPSEIIYDPNSDWIIVCMNIGTLVNQAWGIFGEYSGKQTQGYWNGNKFVVTYTWFGEQSLYSYQFEGLGIYQDVAYWWGNGSPVTFIVDGQFPVPGRETDKTLSYTIDQNWFHGLAYLK